MSHTPLSAQQLYDAGPLGALVRFSDGAAEPPQRHRRKHAAWRSSNGTGRLVRKAPQKQGLPASFTLHVGDFGTADVTVVKAYRVFAVTSPLSFAIVDKPRPGQVALLHDDLGVPTLVHLADTEADAQAWLAAHPRDHVRLVPAEALEPRTFTYLMDPGHGWLIVSRGDLAAAGLSPADFSSCSYVRGDTLALEEDCDMPRFLRRLDELGIPYRLRDQHTDADAHVRRWASNPGPRLDQAELAGCPVPDAGAPGAGGQEHQARRPRRHQPSPPPSPRGRRTA
jgi:hypothetical protein